MMKFFYFLLMTSCLFAEPFIDCRGHQVIHAVKQIKIKQFPDAFNPSIAIFNEEIYLSFRYIPDVKNRPWNSYLGLVKLDENLDLASEPILLNKAKGRKRLPLTEDARLFAHEDKLYMIYNDAIFKYSIRRDILITEIDVENMKIKSKKKLSHAHDGHSRPCQKNWSPFDYLGRLLFTYEINPHQIIYPDPLSGNCTPIAVTENESVLWDYGHLRGGTPALPFEGENLAFFHSSLYGLSENSIEEKWHYFMGAYTFSKVSPFEITSMTYLPLTHPSFYESNECEKFVIFPGGYIFDKENIHIAYGKDDCEIWIATLTIEKLKETLKKTTD